MSKGQLHGKPRKENDTTSLAAGASVNSSSSCFAVVRQIQEYYAAFCAVNEDLFSANCPDSLQLSLPRPPTSAKTLLVRNTEAVLSVLLALKKKPSAIRYAVRGTGI